MKVYADDNFDFDENGRKFSKRVKNTMGKGEIARYKQFLLFPQFFFFLRFVLKTRKTESLFGKGLDDIDKTLLINIPYRAAESVEEDRPARVCQAGLALYYLLNQSIFANDMIMGNTKRLWFLNQKFKKEGNFHRATRTRRSRLFSSLSLLTTQSRLLTTLTKRPFENIIGKGENAGYQYFLLFQ